MRIIFLVLGFILIFMIWVAALTDYDSGVSIRHDYDLEIQETEIDTLNTDTLKLQTNEIYY